MTAPAPKSAAVLTVNNASGMTKRGRYQIAQWLRRQADQIEAEGSDYTTGRFTARYVYRDTMMKRS